MSVAHALAAASRRRDTTARETWPKSKQAKQELEIQDRRLIVTNLDKLLYPETGFTKGQVIDYYIRASKYLLPHFAQRPVMLRRFPDGPSGQAFYEKDNPRFAPDWLDMCFVPRREGSKIEYILINNLVCGNSRRQESARSRP